MHKAIHPPPLLPDQLSGRGTRTPDVPRLLAVLAARQRTLPTVAAMRSRWDDVGTAAADRMVRLLVDTEQSKSAAAGAFNGDIARYLTGTEEGEGGIYRGA